MGVGIDTGGAVVEGGVFVGKLDGAAEGAVAADGDGLGDRVLGDGEEGKKEGRFSEEVHGSWIFGRVSGGSGWCIKIGRCIVKVCVKVIFDEMP